MSDEIKRIEQSAVLRPRSMQEAIDFAKLIAQSDFIPAAYKGKPGNVMAAVQMGAELGLAPLQALQNIAVINGRPSVWGDAALALVQSHPACEDVQETVENGVATCTIRRRGRSPVTRTFSVDDAKKAGLWTKRGPWQEYPNRMLQMRARGFALRDSFADALKGLWTVEESRDIEVDVKVKESSPRSTADQQAQSAPVESTDKWTIPFGKNMGRLPSELNERQLHWYRNKFESDGDSGAVSVIEAELKKRQQAEADEHPVTHYDERGEQVNSETGEVISDPDPSYLDPDVAPELGRCRDEDPLEEPAK